MWLALVRRHASIGDYLFGVRDRTSGESAYRVRTGHAPQKAAAIRNLAIQRQHQMNVTTKGLRPVATFALQPGDAIVARKAQHDVNHVADDVDSFG